MAKAWARGSSTRGTVVRPLLTAITISRCGQTAASSWRVGRTGLALVGFQGAVNKPLLDARWVYGFPTLLTPRGLFSPSHAGLVEKLHINSKTHGKWHRNISPWKNKSL